MANNPNLAALVERMPATDKELEAQKAPPPGQPTDTTKTKARPEKPGGGSKFTAPDPDVAEKIYDEILAGGRESLTELIGLIRDPASDDFKNYKAEYLCHGLTIYVGRTDKAAQRRLFIDTLVAQLGNEGLPLHTRGFLIREFRLAGDPSGVAALGRCLTNETLCADAAAALVSIGLGGVEELRAALPRTTAKCRLVVLQSLAALRDTASVVAFRKALGDEDHDLRLAAAWGLARVGDADSADLLLKAAEVPATWERNKITQACLLLAENLATAGKKTEAAKIYTHLRNTRTDPKEQYIRDAATKALKELGGKLV